ncbi:unnamed protein product, partial [Owenia fusiformis]
VVKMERKGETKCSAAELLQLLKDSAMEENPTIADKDLKVSYFSFEKLYQVIKNNECTIMGQLDEISLLLDIVTPEKQLWRHDFCTECFVLEDTCLNVCEYIQQEPIISSLAQQIIKRVLDHLDHLIILII